ncbi:hypothetical protein [Streptomyces griseochromogenes]|uniref:hypothetical protein n=1 Tax=Streptomyces griseochromogenes TaxID=68214 RepID=UPI003788D40A
MSPSTWSGRVRGRLELLWPPLLSRVDPEADIVLRTQAQHECVEVTLTRLDAAVPAWSATAGADERATLPSALPAPVRDIWHVISRPRHARHISRVRAA